MPELILASSSRYRREQLTRLGLPFSHASPNIDETPQTGETPELLARRLGIAKAAAVATTTDRPALIIGSDQVCDCAGEPLGKPGVAARAKAMLAKQSGQAVTFHTSIVLLNTATQTHHVEVDRTIVHFRDLSDTEIDRYVDQEQPLDCAGAFKSEGLGVSLFEAIDTQDPNALIGLPLIRLCRFLRAERLNPLLVA